MREKKEWERVEEEKNTSKQQGNEGVGVWNYLFSS
jgi:hypothetical protein